MKVLITGANGQLGSALQLVQPDNIDSNSVQVVALNRSQCDLANLDFLVSIFDHHQPDALINAAAYTAVDKAESEPVQAQKINADAVKIMAQWCQKKQIPFIHVSTDFVFDGKKSIPYHTQDEPNPNSVYGASKRDGEQYVLSECDSAYVVRTGWVYNEQGANFVKTILRLASERDQLGIIADQVGTPTYARHLAQMIWQLLSVRPEQKIFHFSDAGVASWYDFAVAIIEEANVLGLLTRKPKIKPITTQDYPTPAQRPAYSVLNKADTWTLLNVEPIHWRNALITMLRTLSV